MAGTQSKSAIKGALTIVAAIGLILVFARPWNWRWTVEREFRKPVTIAQESSRSPLAALPASIKKSTIDAIKKAASESGATRSITEAAPSRKVDPANQRGAYTDPVTFMVGYKDGTGRTVVSPRFDWADQFKEGRAKVEVDGKYGFINEDGEYVVSPEFESIFDYTDGVAVAMKDGWYYFVDGSGRPVSDERFDYAWPHKDGMSLVKRDGYFGYADLRGQLVVPVNLEETFGFNEGLAVAKVGGQFGLVDKRGRFAVAPQYDYAWPVDDGKVLVRENGETYTVDVSSLTEK